MSSTPLIALDGTLVLLDLIDSWFGPDSGAATHAEPALAHEASTQAPSEGSDPMPWAQAYVYGGDGDELESTPVADVAFFAADYHTASLLSRRFDARFVAGPHRVTLREGGVAIIDSVDVVTVPVELPWSDDSRMTRWQASYAFTMRRRAMI